MFRAALRFAVGYLVVLAVLCVATWRWCSLHPRADAESLASVWRDGELVERSPWPTAGSRIVGEGAKVVRETIVADGPVITWLDFAFGISFVPARDGVSATMDGQTIIITPDELLTRQVYDHGPRIQTIAVTLGLDTEKLYFLIGEKLKTTAADVRARASMRRIRVERKSPDDRPRVTGPTLSRDVVRESVIAGAHYLARGLSAEGRFRYTVAAPTNEDLPGYDWPRHAGATFFVAQVAAMTRDPVLIDAARRAATLMTSSGLSTCGAWPCVGDETKIGLGSTALALVALTEIAQQNLDSSFGIAIVGLSHFLRAQQRPDGEFMHYYDRATNAPVDYQGLYYSSEAALALARAYKVTHDPADRDAAARSLDHLVGPAWSFFGDRYYFGEEHWTCQAMAELWPYVPNPKALDFCLRWQEFGRALQQRDGETPFDADGAIGVGPVITPRLTPVASRCEAAVATLDVARRAGIRGDEITALDQQLRRALALLVRQQLRPGPRHLFKEPDAIAGAMPGSEVDWELRIDYTQHAGSAMVRWLELSDVAAR